MLTVTLQEFLALVEQRQKLPSQVDLAQQSKRKKVMRPDQITRPNQAQDRRLATCPQCDAVVDLEIIHPRSGLCPICHDETYRMA